MLGLRYLLCAMLLLVPIPRFVLIWPEQYDVTHSHSVMAGCVRAWLVPRLSSRRA